MSKSLLLRNKQNEWKCYMSFILNATMELHKVILTMDGLKENRRYETFYIHIIFPQ